MIELIVNKETLLEGLDNDPQLLKDVIGIFLADCPNKLAELRTAVMARNVNQIASGAHSLRGSVSIFGATTAVEAARTLESMGGKGDAEDLDEAFSVLERETALLTSALEQIAKDAF